MSEKKQGTPPPKKKKGKYTFSDTYDGTGSLDEIAKPDIGHATWYCLESSVAIMWTRSRDGGAMGVRLYHDDIESKTLWFSNDIEFDEVMEKLKRAVDYTNKP